MTRCDGCSLRDRNVTGAHDEGCPGGNRRGGAVLHPHLVDLLRRRLGHLAHHERRCRRRTAATPSPRLVGSRPAAEVTCAWTVRALPPSCSTAAVPTPAAIAASAARPAAAAAANAGRARSERSPRRRSGRGRPPRRRPAAARPRPDDRHHAVLELGRRVHRGGRRRQHVDDDAQRRLVRAALALAQMALDVAASSSVSAPRA